MSENTSSIDVTDILTRLETIEKAVIDVSEQEEKQLSEEEKMLIDKPEDKEAPCNEAEDASEEEAEKASEDAESEDEAVAEEEPVDKSGEPKRESYDCPMEFHKAYTEWIDKEKEKTPVTQAMLDKALSTFKDDIIKGLAEVKLDGEMTLGEVVKKSIPVPRDAGKAFDYKAHVKRALDINLPIAKET